MMNPMTYNHLIVGQSNYTDFSKQHTSLRYHMIPNIEEPSFNFLSVVLTQVFGFATTKEQGRDAAWCPLLVCKAFRI